MKKHHRILCQRCHQSLSILGRFLVCHHCAAKYIWCPECRGKSGHEPLQPLTVWTADAPDVQDVFAPSIEEVLTMYQCPACLLTFSIHGQAEIGEK